MKQLNIRKNETLELTKEELVQLVGLSFSFVDIFNEYGCEKYNEVEQITTLMFKSHGLKTQYDVVRDFFNDKEENSGYADNFLSTVKVTSIEPVGDKYMVSLFVDLENYIKDYGDVKYEEFCNQYEIIKIKDSESEIRATNFMSSSHP